MTTIDAIPYETAQENARATSKDNKLSALKGFAYAAIGGAAIPIALNDSAKVAVGILVVYGLLRGGNALRNLAHAKEDARRVVTYRTVSQP